MNSAQVLLRNDKYTDMQAWVKAIEAHISLAAAATGVGAVSGTSGAGSVHTPRRKLRGGFRLLLPRVVDMESKSEKCHWLNHVLQRYFTEIISSPSISHVTTAMLHALLTRKFDRIKKPDYLGSLQLKNIHLGKKSIQINEIFVGRSSAADELVCTGKQRCTRQKQRVGEGTEKNEERERAQGVRRRGRENGERMLLVLR